MANEIQYWDVLVKIRFKTYDPDTETTDTQYLYCSKHAEQVFEGNTYIPRILEISGLEGLYIDRNTQSLSSLSITFDDIPDWGESQGPFEQLTAINDWGYQKINVYIKDCVSGVVTEVFWGYTKRNVKIDSYNKKFGISASFLWDSTKIKIPSNTFQHSCIHAFGGSPYEHTDESAPGVCGYPGTSTNGAGGNPTFCDKGFDTPDGCVAHGMAHAFGGFTKIAPRLNKERNNFVAREDVRKSGIPLVFGLGEMVVRPEVIHARIVDGKMYATFVVSATNPGMPFAVDAITPDKVKLFSHRKAIALEWLPGLDVQPPPANTTRFPDGSGHSRLAMGCAVFELTAAELDEFKGDGADVKLHAIKLRMNGGRGLRRLSGGQTDNLIYILEDILRDDVLGLSLDPAEIDTAVIVSEATYNSSRFPGRVEIDTQTPLLEFVQDALGSFHGYITWNNGKMQIRCKKDNETHSKTFGTGGRKLISIGEVKPYEQDDTDLINQYTVTGRSQYRKRYAFTYIDKGAQIKAGGGQVLANDEDIFLFGVNDPYAMLVSGAILLREEQNLNYFIEIETPLLEGHDVLPGEVIQVLSSSIINNPANNTLWRVIGKQYKLGDEPTVVMRCQVYKQLVYAYNAQAINGDIIRSGEDTTYFTAPPNVILDDPGHQPTLAVIDSTPTDDDTKLLTIQCKWKNPEIDPADVTEQEQEGTTVSGPLITGVQLAWRYTHEPVRNLRYPVEVAYPEEEALLRDIEYHKDFDIEVWFIALGANNSHGQVGYVIDPTRTTGLDQDISDIDTTFDIVGGGDWTPVIGDQCKCENEIMEVTGVAGSTITVLRGQVGTVAGAHEDGTEIGVVIASHPTAILDLNAPRFTYPVVGNVRTRSRRTGTRIIWDDVKKKNKEDYHVYWSADTAQLATDNPAWYMADPDVPPSEIMLKETRATSVKIPFEEIDAEKVRLGQTGRDIVVRVAARNRRNYSSTLSALSGAGHTNGPTAPPADPILADIEFIDTDPTSDKIDCYFKVYATADRLGTYDSTGAQSGGIRIARYKKATSSWQPPHTFFEQSENPATDLYVIVHRRLRRGSLWRMERAVTKNDAGRSRSNDVTIEFRVGTAMTDDLSVITDLSIVTLTDKGSRKTVVGVEWTNPSPAPSLRSIKLWTKEGADVDYHVEDKERLLDTEYFQTAGLKTIDLMCQHNKGDTVWYYLELIGTDGDRITTSAISAVALDDDAGDLPIDDGPNGPGYPDAGWITRNTVIGDPAHGNVAFGYRVFMDGSVGDNVFGSPDPGFGPVRDLSLVLQPRNAANTLDVGEIVQLNSNAFPDKGSLLQLQEITGKLELGQRYRIAQLRYFNSSDEVIRPAGTVIDFIGGAQSYSFNATALTAVSIAYSASTTDTRHGLVTVNFTQTAIPVLLKRIVIEVSYNGGTTWAKAAAENLLDDAPYFAVASLPRTYQKRIQHKKDQNQFRVRAILIPYGSDYESTYILSPNLVIAQTSNETILDDGYVTGTNPTTPAAGPVFKLATIGNGGLFASFEKPVDSRPTFEHYEFQFADSNSTTGGGSVTRFWLDCDDGNIAVSGVAANTDNNIAAGPLASATFVSKTNRFSEAHLKRRDLDPEFKSGTEDGTLTLFVKCRLVDRTDAGAFRYGDWSAWGTVVKKATQDRDTDTPSRNHAAGTGNGFEGWGCNNSASQFPSAAGNHGTTATLGLNFYAQPRNNDEELSIRPHLAVLGVPGTMKYVGSGPGSYVQQSGNPWDNGNRGIYWHKNVPAIAVYGNAGRTDYPIWNGLTGASGGPTNIQPSINCRISGNVRVGEIYWAVFAVAVENATNLPSVAGIFARLWDRASGLARYTSPSMTWSFTANQTFKLIAIRVTTATTFTGNAWFQFTFPTWTQDSTRILYISNGIWRRGPTPPRVWVPGKYEANLDPVTGVTFSSFGINLTTVDMAGGWSTDGITTYGELEL